MNKDIETLKAKMLKLPAMSMELFDNVLENIDEDYPFSLSPKLILALLITMGICVIAIGIIFIWYKKENFSHIFHGRKFNKASSFFE